MEKEFIPYELALRMKKLGFDEPCFGYFCNDRRDCKLEFTPVKLAKNWNGIESNLDESPIYNSRNKKEVKESLDERNLLFLWTSAPTWQSAFKWFRKNYRLSVNIHDCLDDFEAIITQWTLSDNKIVKEFPQRADISYPNNRFDSYEEAEQACLEKLIEIVESEKK